MSTEPWTAEEDPPPYGREIRDREPARERLGTGVLLAVLVAAAAVMGYYYWDSREPPAARAPVVTRPPAEAPAVEKSAPLVQHPVPAAETAPAHPLPTLDGADSSMREFLVALIGARAFESMAYPPQLIRKIVATIDNLPRKSLPVRTRVLRPVPGQFVPDAANSMRYTQHVRIFSALDTRALVKQYVRFYPLFQRAYAELGYPERHFNDRLVESIDDMLAAPDPGGTPAMVQPKVLYLYADPALESRSAGQKLMMRLSSADAVKVKAKLREIRREVTKETQQAQDRRSR